MDGTDLIEKSNLQILTDTKNRYNLLKTKELQSVSKIEASLLRGARKYFEDSGFTEIVVPHLTQATGACENFMTVFEVQFFGGRKYLAQTGQLYLETMTPFFERVWCAGPSFRAEPDVDDRHLIEFPLLEIEHQGYFKELLEHIEKTITSMVQETLNRNMHELEFLGSNIGMLKMVKPPFEKITYTKAVDLLSEFGVNWGDDLKSKHEKFLVEMFGRPLFITHFPKSIKFFNMKEDDTNSEVVKSADLILPFSGEAVGAAEREYEYEKLRDRLSQSTMLKLLEQRGGSIRDFDWFLDFYKNHEAVPHSGCGFGLNRVTQFVINSNDIRASTTFPSNREAVI
ncbi:MAG: hypothetical protein J4452_01065 [Candidatus Aenigmarchaeota archaeon]|nr:hypothetical protein [Candidatus Aenigmarchaeota archaeon]